MSPGKIRHKTVAAKAGLIRELGTVSPSSDVRSDARMVAACPARRCAG